MAYAKEVLHRAEARLDEARRQNELDCDRRISAIYEKLPRLREIDRELRKTSAKVYAAAFRGSESPEQAMQTLKQENLSLQRERDWILESENIDPEDLEREPVCKLCGGSGWRGAAMCECLRELCRQEQKKALMQAFGAGKESFEKFRLDVYPERIDPKLGISPRALMKRVYESAVSYTKTFSEGSDSLLFMGATGLGKTFLSGCIANDADSRYNLNIYLNSLPRIKHFLIRLGNIFRIRWFNSHLPHFAEDTIKTSDRAGITSLTKFNPKDN